MGRMETIKQRAIYVCVPSIEQKERRQRYAEKQGISISKFVVEYVENSLRPEEEHGYRLGKNFGKRIMSLGNKQRGWKRRIGFWNF